MKSRTRGRFLPESNALIFSSHVKPPNGLWFFNDRRRVSECREGRIPLSAPDRLEVLWSIWFIFPQMSPSRRRIPFVRPPLSQWPPRDRSSLVLPWLSPSLIASFSSLCAQLSCIIEKVSLLSESSLLDKFNQMIKTTDCVSLSRLSLRGEIAWATGSWVPAWKSSRSFVKPQIMKSFMLPTKKLIHACQNFWSARP
jgi:hypothetical protein